MNILQITALYKLRSGGAVQMYTLSEELVRRGHRVTAVFGSHPGFSGDFGIIDTSLVDVRFMDLPRLKLNARTFKAVAVLRRFICKGGFDIIHVHKGAALNLVYLATMGLDIPIVANRGMTSPLTWTSAFKYRSRRVRKIIAVAGAVKDVLVETGGIDPGKIDVVYGSVDTGDYRPDRQSTLREELGIPADVTVIGYVGSALRRKGLPYLIEAFAGIAAERGNVVLVMVGVSADELARFDVPQGIEARIISTGFRQDVANCMGAFDCFVFPGIEDEGLTGTVREAAASGLPVITSDVGGNRELIDHMYSGMVVPKEDAESLRSALIYLLDHEEDANRFAVNARRFVEERMSVSVRGRMIESIYRELAAE